MPSPLRPLKSPSLLMPWPASRDPSSSCRPPQAKMVRAHINRCGRELFEKDLVDLRASYDTPLPSVIFGVQRPPTEPTLLLRD
ncbi:hypothetical protein LIER_33106 [Lithospermum erythrorhizon]|uniref:Uncharacterized protein n=1 Tax=Lithospermum erythrorhizon TaxID=34254 RepID=A0AAV3RVR4_LITER